METITKYKAIDGVEFVNKEECVKYELLINRVNSIMNMLPKRPDTTDFTNGNGYIQHDVTTLKNAKVSLLTICKEYIDHKWIQQAIDRDDIHPSWVGRLLGDYGIRPLDKAWHRFFCMDFSLREYGQPYFAEHPKEAKNICINPTN